MKGHVYMCLGNGTCKNENGEEKLFKCYVS